MEDGERLSIRDKARSLKKYGSTCNHVRNSTNFTLIHHDVTASDTLQGIALKYGCSMEQLRRTNRLYASDSLFSKPYLKVPVAKGSPYYPVAEPQRSEPNNLPDNHWPHSTLFPSDRERDATFSAENSHSQTADPWHPLQPAAGPSGSQSAEFAKPKPKSEPIEELLSPEEEHKKDLDALLGKIDSTIANSRKFVVTKSQDSSEFAARDEEEDYLDGDYYDGSYQNSSHRSSCSSGQNYHQSSDDTSHLITNSRQVKSSLRRLEQTQDELFEL